MAIFYDTHAHLDYPDFAADLPQIIERAKAAGITKIISIGTDFESSARAVKLSEQYPGVFAAVGWHPTNATEAPEDLRPGLRELAKHPKVVAIGETGWTIIECRASSPEAFLGRMNVTGRNRLKFSSNSWKSQRSSA